MQDMLAGAARNFENQATIRENAAKHIGDRRGVARDVRRGAAVIGQPGFLMLNRSRI